jgi:signal transduction histidine kinase
VSASSAMQELWLPGLAAVLGVGAAVAGLRRLRRRPPAEPPSLRAAPPELRSVPLLAGEVDVAAEIRTVLERLAGPAKRQLVTFTTAIEPGLVARADGSAFRQAVSDLVESAIRRAPCGTVLLTAGRLGGRVQVTIGDDGMAGSLPMPESALCGIAQLVGLQGGTLDIDPRPGEGTIATIRLPAGQRATEAGRSETVRRITSPV